MNDDKEFENYILSDCCCDVCGEGFKTVEDAIDAGTDLYVHKKCAKHWHGAWLNGDINI